MNYDTWKSTDSTPYIEDKYPDEEEPPMTSIETLTDARMHMRKALRHWQKATQIVTLSSRRRSDIDRTLYRMQDAISDIDQELEKR